MALVAQTSKFPTRKIMAVILSGMITGVIQSLLRYFWPDHPFSPYMEDVDIWLQGVIMVYAGYMTKEKDNVPAEQTNLVQEPVDSGDAQLSFDPLWTNEEERGEAGSGERNPEGQRGEAQ
jgi:hypothetical protein